MAKAARRTSQTSSRKKVTASKKTSRRKAGGRAATTRTSSSRKSAKQTKDPRGGLTAAGRAAFRKRDGSNLKPGVTKKKIADMTPQEMRRKGSWAVRFYGSAKMPPLVDKNGEPTRHALSAHAWGEPVPKTVAAARKIAAKGHKLLERYQRVKEADAKSSSAKKGSGQSAKRKTSSTRKSTTRKSAVSRASDRRSAARRSSATKRKSRSSRATRKAA